MPAFLINSSQLLDLKVNFSIIRISSKVEECDSDAVLLSENRCIYIISNVTGKNMVVNTDVLKVT